MNAKLQLRVCSRFVNKSRLKSLGNNFATAANLGGLMERHGLSIAAESCFSELKHGSVCTVGCALYIVVGFADIYSKKPY